MTSITIITAEDLGQEVATILSGMSWMNRTGTKTIMISSILTTAGGRVPVIDLVHAHGPTRHMPTCPTKAPPTLALQGDSLLLAAHPLTQAVMVVVLSLPSVSPTQVAVAGSPLLHL
jgi:hypothetical protein